MLLLTKTKLFLKHTYPPFFRFIHSSFLRNVQANSVYPWLKPRPRYSTPLPQYRFTRANMYLGCSFCLLVYCFSNTETKGQQPSNHASSSEFRKNLFLALLPVPLNLCNSPSLFLFILYTPRHPNMVAFRISHFCHSKSCRLVNR